MRSAGEGDSSWNALRLECFGIVGSKGIVSELV